MKVEEYLKLTPHQRRPINKILLEDNLIFCPSCQEINHKNYFEDCLGRLNGKQVYCRICRMKQKAKRKNEDFIPYCEVFIAKNPTTHKKCHKCLEDKPFDMFSKEKKTKDGLARWCNTCKRTYESENREHLNKLHLKTYHKHKDKISKQLKEKRKTDKEYRERMINNKKKWEKENKEHVKKYARKYARTDRYRKANKFRNHISKQRTGISFSKEGKKYLGCTKEEFLNYLENQNSDYMDGKKYHLDHIIPFKVFDFRKEIDKKIAFNYRNVQPLYYVYNSKKKDNLNIAMYYLKKQIALNGGDEFYKLMLGFLEDKINHQKKNMTEDRKNP
jgi:hypothetical protein